MGILTHDGGLSYVVDVVLSMLWRKSKRSKFDRKRVLAKTSGTCHHTNHFRHPHQTPALWMLIDSSCSLHSSIVATLRNRLHSQIVGCITRA
jgi:hypothetical protein